MSFSITQFSKAVVAGLAVSITASAASADALQSNFSFRIVDADDAGQEILVERSAVKPGEVIHYDLRHENKTDDAMAGLVIAAPVPDGVTITFDGQHSSVPAVFEVQADLDPEAEGLEWSTLPAVRMVADETGTLVEQPLPADAITAVRWSLTEPLAGGETALNSYRVRVN